MKLYLYGHDYKYAAEQMLLTMFPGERPEYPEGRPAGDRMELRLSRGEKFTTASCKLVLGENDEMPDLSGKTVPAGTLEVAPGGCTFIVL